MKELSIKEKAQRYDEAINAIKELKAKHPTALVIKDWIKENFPELAESEDERIRKEIITHFKAEQIRIKDSKRYNSWLTWLEKQGKIATTEDELEALRIAAYEPTKNWSEKLQSLYEKLTNCEQGEQNLANKVKPKFHKDDWVVSPNGVYWHIDAINNNRYEVSSTDGACADWSLNTSIYHLWTIQDAKDGDVLYSIDSKQPFIYKERPQFSQAIGYCCINKFGEFAIWNTSKCVICTDKYIPATKEQRDLLFQKMREAGYEWDAEQKQLKKIEQNPDIDQYSVPVSDNSSLPTFDENIYHPCTEEVYEQKHTAWSEDDEERLDSIIESYTELLKDYKAFHDVDYIPYKSDTVIRNVVDDIRFLKSLKDRVLPQPKQEWSEDDGRLIKFLIAHFSVCHANRSFKFDINTDLLSDEIIERIRNLRPQSAWKPSEEQITWLYRAADDSDKDSRMKQVLNELLSDLKKLR